MIDLPFHSFLSPPHPPHFSTLCRPCHCHRSPYLGTTGMALYYLYHVLFPSSATVCFQVTVYQQSFINKYSDSEIRECQENSRWYHLEPRISAAKRALEIRQQWDFFHKSKKYSQSTLPVNTEVL